MAKPSEGKFLYHITHIDNMPSILREGLVPRSDLNKQNMDFQDIADSEIIVGRQHYKQDLSQYVPFHFYAKNPFDGAVCKKYGSENMVIITISRMHHKKNNFYIIPSHPLDREEPEIFSYEEGYDKIKWNILDDLSNRDYHDPEIKKACMAECIVPYPVPPGAFAYVYVKTEIARKSILKMAGSAVIQHNISVAPYMFP